MLVFGEYQPAVHRSASTDESFNSVFRFSTESFSALVMEGNVVSWFFSSSLFKGDAAIEKFGTNLRNTLQRPKKDLTSVCLVRSSTSRTAADVTSYSSDRPGCMMCPRSLILSKKVHFSSWSDS